MSKMNEARTLRDYLEGKIRLEKDQLRAVTSGKRLIVVTAGAGTGKTLTLAWRFLWLVAAEGVPVDGILTITFTEKAALEMKERIRNLMEGLIRDVPALAHRLEPALERLDEAYISTIHAFSMRVLKENALALELDPEARVINGSEDTAFWLQLERVFDRSRFDLLLRGLSGTWFSRGVRTFGDGKLLDLLNTFGPVGVASFVAAFISHFASRDSSPEDIWARSTSPEAYDGVVSAELEDRFSKPWEEAFTLWMERIIPAVDLEIGLDGDRTILSSRLRALRDGWKGKTPRGERLARFIGDLFGKGGPLHALNNSKVKKAAEALLVEETGQSCVQYRQGRTHWVHVSGFMLEGFPAPESDARRLLLQTSALCWKFRDSANLARGILTFDDLIRFASEAITAAPSYRDRFSHVLIDEFQDTDKLQDRMIRGIADHEGCSLFIVGDLQQSIYRFRHAEPGIFWKTLSESREREDGEDIALDVSFRSRGELMNGVNRFFASVWVERIAEGIHSPYAPLSAPDHHEWWPRRQGASVPAATCIIATQEGKGGGDGENPGQAPVALLRKTALGALAEFIDEAVSGGKTVWDTGAGSLRPVQFRDVVILVPTRTQYEALEEAFIEAKGFPVYFEGNRNYFSRGEVRDIAAALKSMADPDDALALASFLSSPLSGLRLSEAASLLSPKGGKLQGKRLLDSFSALRPTAAQRFLKRRMEARIEGPSSAIAGFLQEEETLLSFPSWKRRRVAANLRRAVDIAREYETFMDTSLAGCAEYLEKVTARGIQAEETDVIGEQEDMIRVMTVHSAKGLEFPVVAVAGLEYSSLRGGKSASVLPSSWLGAVTSKLPDSWDHKPEDTLGKTLHRILDESETLEEQERLLYVACTRARDALVLCGICKNGDKGREPEKNSWLETVMAPGHQRLAPITFVTPGENSSRSSKTSPEKKAASGGEVLLSGGRGRSLERLSATGFALFCFCPFAWRMRYRQALDLRWESPAEDGHGGAEAGSLAHWVLSRWDLEAGSLDRWLPLDEETRKRTIIFLPPDLRPVARDPLLTAKIRKWLEDFARSPTAEIMRNSPSLKREVPFRVRLEGGPTLIGAIDALYGGDEGYRLLDYKVSAAGGAPDTLYQAQLSFYAAAAAAALGRRPEGLALYHLPQGLLHPLPVREDTLEKVSLEIRRVSQTAAEGPFEPSLENCAVCPWKTTCQAR